jgi:hypothetical protein
VILKSAISALCVGLPKLYCSLWDNRPTFDCGGLALRIKRSPEGTKMFRRYRRRGRRTGLRAGGRAGGFAERGRQALIFAGWICHCRM